MRTFLFPYRSPATVSDSFLCYQPLLEKVSSQLIEDPLISSSASLSKMSKSSGHPKFVQSASRRYSSPLEYSQPGYSGYRKRAASPARGRSAKWFRGGRGGSPSVNSERGFRK